MKTRILLLLLAAASLTAFVGKKEFLFKAPSEWPKPEYDFSKNPLSAEKVALGRKLFYDPILSKDNSISCSGCHSQYTAFAHVDHALSHGFDNHIGKRNAPALVNLAWNKNFMWDGSIQHLVDQAVAPISNPNEMNEDIGHVAEKLQHTANYPMLFFNAFGDSIINGEKLLSALAQFELTIESTNSKYDSVMRKQAVFTAQENNGYQLYKANCSSCHAEPLFTNNAFENNGLPIDSNLNDLGRMSVTMNADDSLKFKVPSLRNLEYSYPYMHDGRFKKLKDVLDHYTAGIQKSKTLSEKLQKPIVLSSNERVDLIAFLLTLTDRDFLFNKKYMNPATAMIP